MKKSLYKSWVKVGLASLVLTASGALAVAQPSVLDGLPLTSVQAGGVGSVSDSFTVSSSVNSALVVEVYSRDSQNTTDPGPTMGLSWNIGFGTQALTEGIGEPNGASSYSWVDIFYLFNPAVGSTILTATDTVNPPAAGGMAMLVFDLQNVNTAINPTGYAANGAPANNLTTLSITTGAGTPTGAFAALAGSFGNNGNPIIVTTSDSGTVNSVTQGALAEAMFGYEFYLSGGATTITESITTGSNSKMAEAGLVFSPIGVVPEPSSGLLFGAGAALFGLISLIRRKIS